MTPTLFEQSWNGPWKKHFSSRPIWACLKGTPQVHFKLERVQRQQQHSPENFIIPLFWDTLDSFAASLFVLNWLSWHLVCIRMYKSRIHFLSYHFFSMQTMSFAANADMEQVHQCIIDIYHSSIYVMISHFQFLPVKNVKRSFAILILHDWHFVSKICDMFFFRWYVIGQLLLSHSFCWIVLLWVR